MDHIRTIVAFALCGLGVPLTADAQVRYAPGSYRYEMVTEMRQKQEMMGVATESSMRLFQLVTVSLSARHRDTLAVTIVVDSLHVDVGQPIPDSLIPNLRGMTVTGTMSPLGHLYALGSTVDSLAGLADDFRTFFTPLPAEIAVGKSWVDTMSVDVNPAGFSLGQMTMAITSRVSADTTYEGTPAWRIERTSAGSGGGTNNDTGTPMIFDMKATGVGNSFFGKNGVYLGGTGTSESTSTVSVPQHNITLPVTATGSLRVRLLRTQ